MGCSCATCPITFSAEKFGTGYAAVVASPCVSPCDILANPRRSSAKLPITNSEKANTADSSGDENDENSSASEHRIRNCSTMKNNATRIQASDDWNLCETYSRAAKTPMAMKNVFTNSVPVSPKNLPTMNSQRRTGRESTVYR